MDYEVLMMFDFTVYKDNSVTEFKKACAIFEEKFPQAYKENILEDVDGTLIQSYQINGKETTIYNDYDVGAVYLKSEMDLSKVFN